MFHDKPVIPDALGVDATTALLQGARDYQQDSLVNCFSLGSDFGYAVLADGMGGQSAGHLASALVVTEMYARIKMREMALEDGELDISALLTKAARAANKRVADAIAEDEDVVGMGSTALGIVIRGNKLYWISIGDSPLLLFRDGALRQLNKDHSMAPQIDLMVKSGSLDAALGSKHPDRSILNSAITGEPIEMIDCPRRPLILLPDDVLIAASDGLQSLSSAVIAKTLQANQEAESAEIAGALLSALEEQDHPEQDNAAIIAIKLGASRADRDVDMLADLPVLATGGAREDVAETMPAEPEPEAAPAPDERKAYWYRGQKYYKD